MKFSTRSASYLIGIFFVGLVIKLTTLHKFEKLETKAPTNAEITSVATMEKELQCMALNIYREAGYEPIEGRVAVAQVTMNRVASSDFPNDVCGVVYQKNRVVTKVVCQFSWYCDSKHRNRPINQKAYDEAYEVAKKVMLENFRLDTLNDALYYHADYVNPRWRLERITKIGTHIFYRPIGQDHPKLSGA